MGFQIGGEKDFKPSDTMPLPSIPVTLAEVCAPLVLTFEAALCAASNGAPLAVGLLTATLLVCHAGLPFHSQRGVKAPPLVYLGPRQALRNVSRRAYYRREGMWWQEKSGKIA